MATTRMSRRGFVRGAVIAGMAALSGAVIATIKPILAPRLGNITGEVVQGFIYTAPSSSRGWVPWYQNLLGQEAAPSHFTQVGQAATTLWRALRDSEGKIIPGTGSAALLMKVDKDSPPGNSIMRLPGDLQETVTMKGFVAAFDICVHLCCNPAVHFVNPGGSIIEAPPTEQDVLIQNPGAVVAPQIGVIYCPCHHSQYDPFDLVWNTHPNGTKYLGAHWVWGPAKRALPIIPVQISGDSIQGVNTHPEWYRGYCGL